MSAVTSKLPHRGAWAVVVAMTLALLGLAGSITFGVLASRAASDADNRSAALAEARARIPVLLSYAEPSLKKDLASSESQTVGAFHSDYKKLIDAVILPVAQKKHISTKATVTGAGVVGASGPKVRVLIFLTQTTTAPGATTSVNSSRVVVTMQQDGNTWKIAGLQPE